jgi:two-component sensor histidine kinase
MLVSARRLVHPDSNSRVLLLSIVDATERQRREEQKNFVIGELRHRMKNVFAVVGAMARQTRAAGCTGEEYRDAFLGRLDALVRANGFALDSDRTVHLGDLVRATLEPYAAGSERVALESAEEVELTPEQVLPLSLILHELATNAVKYGALSVTTGRIRISWTIEGEEGNGRTTQVLWRESGGPASALPTTKGFGTKLIDLSATRDLGGHVERTFAEDGLSVDLRFPL